MSLEVPPKQDRYLRIVNSQNLEVDRHKIITLVDDMKPMYQGIRVFNRTKSAEVRIAFDGAGTIIIEVTNEKENDTFQFTIEETPK